MISEIVVYVVTTSLFPLMILELLISQHTFNIKPFEYLETEVTLLQFVILLLYIYSAVLLYTYLFSSKSFRRDFIRLFSRHFQKVGSRTNINATGQGTRILCCLSNQK